jgi:hypothetical protein
VRTRIPASDDHIVAVTERRQESLDVGRVVLPIGIEKHENITTSCARAALYRGSVPDAVRMAYNRYA